MKEKSKRELRREEKIKEENIRKLEEHIKEQKKIPKEYRKKIIKKLCVNFVVLFAMIIFLTCINVMSLYIETSIYLKVLRILSIVVAVISIVYFELGYRKDNEKLFLYGVEILVLALITLFSVYMYYLFFEKFNILLGYITGVIILYYCAKGLIIKKNMKKQYYKEQNDIKDIIKK